MKVAVLGLGYVGTVTAACLASRGHDVWGVDVAAAKVDEIRAGRSPVAEPGLNALVARAVADGTLRATASCTDALDRADVSLVCVGHRQRHRVARICVTSGGRSTTSWRHCASCGHRTRVGTAS